MYNLYEMETMIGVSFLNILLERSIIFKKYIKMFHIETLVRELSIAKPIEKPLKW